MRQYLAEVLLDTPIRFFRTDIHTTVNTSEQLLRTSEQRPPPTILTSMLIAGIDKILRHDIPAHLQSGEKRVKPTPHFRPGKSAQSTQVTSNQATVFLQRQQNSLLYAARSRKSRIPATPITKVRPPFLGNKTSLSPEELAICAATLPDDFSFPFPKRPLPATIGQWSVLAIFVHQLFCRPAVYPHTKQRQKTDLINKGRQFGTAMYFRISHVSFPI